MLCAPYAVQAQDPAGSVVPSAPLPGQGLGVSLPAPAMHVPAPANPAGGKRLQYGELPLNPDDAKAKIIELENLLAISRPQDLQERVYQLCEWLGDMSEAHNKLANVFSRRENMKGQSAAERQSAQRFAQLRNQAQLLKADLLIGLHRFPEALAPLIDIVVAEPTSGTGQAAYKRLRELGFSPEPVAVDTISVAPIAAPPTKIKQTVSSKLAKPTEGRQPLR